MKDANEPPKIPWWVRYWIGPTTTRSSLWQQVWLYFLLAAVFVGISFGLRPWRPTWFTGEFVLPVAVGLYPVAFTGAGIWVLVAVRWIDRNQAWDCLPTKEEREAEQESQSLWLRSRPWGLVFMAIGAAVGSLVGWFWANEGSVWYGLALGVIGGFVLGVLLAGFKEGLRSNVGKSVDAKPQGDEKHNSVDGSPDADRT